MECLTKHSSLYKMFLRKSSLFFGIILLLFCEGCSSQKKESYVSSLLGVTNPQKFVVASSEEESSLRAFVGRKCELIAEEKGLLYLSGRTYIDVDNSEVRVYFAASHKVRIDEARKFFMPVLLEFYQTMNRYKDRESVSGELFSFQSFNMHVLFMSSKDQYNHFPYVTSVFNMGRNIAYTQIKNTKEGKELFFEETLEQSLNELKKQGIKFSGNFL